VLGDMPFVTVQHLRHLLARWDAEETPVIGSVTKGVAMPPALFARSRFAALRANTGDHGARGLLATAKLIEAPPEQLADVDTIDDLLRLRALR
jgi:molybdenum cofactor cytidylyltransferase